MKYIKYLTLIAIVITFSCKSTYREKNNFQFKNNPFKVMDSLELVNREMNFKINPSENWKLLNEYGSKYFSPDDEKSWPKTSLNIYKNIVKENYKGNVTLDDYLEYHVLSQKRWNFKDFKYKLVKTKHKLYGEVYVMNYIHRYNLNNQVENSLFLIVYKNYGYTLEYKAKPEDFYKRLPEVEKMINTFRVL